MRFLSISFFLLLATENAQAHSQFAKFVDVLKTIPHTKEEASHRQNFRLVSSEGRAWTLAENDDRKFVILAAWESSCPLAKSVMYWLANTAARAGDDVRVLFLDPSLRPDRSRAEALRPMLTKHPVLMDPSQTVTQSFGLARTGDYVVVDPRTGAEIHRGSAYDEGLAKFLGVGGSIFSAERARGLVGKARLAWAGCRIPVLPLTKIDQAKAVEAFEKACMGCHQANPATDTFRSLKDVRGWHEMNRLVMRNFLMPPGGLDTESEMCFWPRYRLSSIQENLGLVQRWIEAGEPYELGEGEADPIAKARENVSRTLEDEAEWYRQFKDKVGIEFTAPVTDFLPAEGTQKYIFRLLGGPTKEDLYVKTAILTADVNILHHAVLYVLPFRPRFKGKHDVVWEEELERQRVWQKFWEWNSFNLIQPSWPGTVFHIPKGSYLVLQQHYDPIGKPWKNRSKVSFELERASPNLRVARKYSFDREKFVIPPHEKHFELVKRTTIDRDASLVLASAHGHFRLARYYFVLTYPDGSKRRLCNVVFHQVQYENVSQLRKPIFVPKGTEIAAHLIYDNSRANTLNPDPSLWVKSGNYYEWHEMDVARIVEVEGRLEDAIDLRDNPN